MKSKVSMIVILVVMCCAVRGEAVQAKNEKTVILPTDTAVASEGNTLVGLQGSYASDVEAAVKRINEIRLEACVNGYPDPRDSSRKLTLGDYVPIKWSTDYEYIARIRAAESAILTKHARPNGKSYGDLQSPNGISCFAEVLAWQSWNGTIVDAIDNWYEEKSIWVSGGKGVTGHYTQMINPSSRYAGVATFNCDTVAWQSSSAGKFGYGKDGMLEAPCSVMKNCIQTVEVPSVNLGKTFFYKEGFNEGYNDKEYDIEDTITFDLARQLMIGEDNSVVFDRGNIIWSTSDASVATVDNYGKVKIVGFGKARITAVSDSGISATEDICIKNNLKNTSIRKIISGKKKLIITWDKVSGKGYQIQYATNKKFTKNVKTKRISKAKTTKVTLKKLKNHKKYYIRIRTIKKINGNEYFSSWSSKKVKKTK